MKTTRQKSKWLRLLSMALIISLLTGTQGFTVLAEAVSENAVTEEVQDGQESYGTEDGKNPDANQEGNSGTGDESIEANAGTGDGNIEDNSSTDQIPVAEDSFAGLENEEALQAGAGSTVNPVHHCTKDTDLTGDTDTTQWSYVYFGSYPQSEVTDQTIIAAVDSAILVAGLTSNGEGTDVWVNGTKYRRISKTDVDFDKYYGGGTNNGYRYFKWERIKWKVLQNNGSTLFVMADKALDCKAYNEEYAGITWEQCTLRSWLNGSFYNTAFSSDEQDAIVPQTVVNEDNPEYETEGGSNTNDKVYLLSIEEAMNPDYGFCSDAGINSASRWMQVSPYAHARGTYTYNGSKVGEKGNCWWRLRSPGIRSYSAAHVCYTGSVHLSGFIVSDSDDGISPALHIKLSSALWSMTDDGTSGAGGENKILTSLKAEKKKTVYMQGEKLNVDDLKVTAYYTHSVYGNTEELLTEGYTTNAAEINMNTKGNKTLRISYTKNGVTKTSELAITVNQKTDVSQNQQAKIKKLTIKAPSKRLAAGKKVKLTVKTAPANAANKAVTWKTSNKKYATISKNGKLTLKKAGAGKTVTITATAKDGSKKKAKIKIKIMKHAVKSIKLKAPAKTLKAGKSMTVKATIKTTGKKVNKTLKWKSSNKKYATVNKKGKVTAKKAGKGKTVTITAVSTDGTNKKAKVRIKIK